MKKASTNTGTDGFRRCVASQVTKARFKKTQNGATISYPFVFR